jgi:stage II sporulation protein D
VAARSYVLAARDPELDYDVCATVLCQVYGGASAEHPATDRAVAQTRDLVLTFEGGLAKTYYHSHSGGYLASSLEVWGTARPYLPGHADVASPPPHHAWDFRLDPAAMAQALAAQGVALGPVRRLQVLDISASGRVTRASIVGDGGQALLWGEELTRLLRSWGLKSTRFTMRSELVAQGGGYGHGVGMSQYGAYSLAAAGRGYEDILRFYYPGTTLEPLRAGLLESLELPLKRTQQMRAR